MLGAQANKTGGEPGALIERDTGQIGVINFSVGGFGERLFVQKEMVLEQSDATQIALVLAKRGRGKIVGRTLDRKRPGGKRSAFG